MNIERPDIVRCFFSDDSLFFVYLIQPKKNVQSNAKMEIRALFEGGKKLRFNDS